MESDCRAMHEYEMRQPSLRDGKRLTRWMPLGAQPRTALEEAILHLARLAKAGPRLVGYEWWIQAIGGAAPLGFHVDKDEAVASNEHYLLHPLWSSVFYVTSTGGGTLITNQWSPRGSGYEPIQPDEAAWSFPEANKFLLFNGTLLHGVVPGSATGTAGSPQQQVGGIGRITFLVNFWHVKPKEPNCLLLKHEEVPGLTLLSPEELEALRVEDAAAPSPKAKRQPLTVIDMAPGSNGATAPPAGVTSFRMDLPGGAVQHVNLPVFPTPPKGQTFHLHYQRRSKKQKQQAAKQPQDDAEDAAEEEEEKEVAVKKVESATARATRERREAAAAEAAAKKARRAARRRGETVPPTAEAAAKQAQREQQARREKELREQQDEAETVASGASAKRASKAASSQRGDWPPPPPLPKVRTGTTLERLEAARLVKEQLRERWEL
jgi:hypothetical protein